MRLRALLATLLGVACLWSRAADVTAPVSFRDATAESGVRFHHTGGSLEKKYIFETMSGGVVLFDYDNDGRTDAYLVNGASLEILAGKAAPARSRLFRNLGRRRFEDVTERAGVGGAGWGMGGCAADYDNDGWTDLYVTNFGKNLLYHNNGDGTFTDVTDRAGVGDPRWSTGAAWADYDRDGYVDLFVARYVHLDMDKLPEFGSNEKFCRYKGILVQCGPWGMEGESDLLFRNRGDGTFEEVSKKAGVDDPRHRYGLGAVWGDYDNDGWPDLYVANDAGPNFLYRNKHDGTFEEVGMLSGIALGGDGQEQGSMGVDWGDYLHNGRLSMFVTNFTEQPSTLYRNLGKDGFSDVSGPAKLGQPTFPYDGWGTAFFDVDNDGWLDVFQANGHVYPQVDSIPGGPSYRQPMQLFRNNRDGTFEDVSRILSNIPAESRRGAAFGDINNDGNIGIVVVNVGAPPTLLLNQGGNSNHRVLFKLIGTKSNKMAIGARVTVKAGKLVQFSEVRAGGSYLSSNDPRLHFGLGAETTITEVEIRWPSSR